MPDEHKRYASTVNFLGLSPSYQIIILLSVILIGIFIGSYMVVDNLKILRDDAAAINKLGIIRGSIQLVTKRELNHVYTSEQIKLIDDTVIDIKTNYLIRVENAAHIEQNEIDAMLASLEQRWRELKNLYTLNRQKGTHDEQIIKLSDLCWELANSLVFKVQRVSETKLSNYQNIIVITLLIISALVFLIITMVYKIVHNILEHDVITDPLTGLFNRTHFNQVLYEQIALYKRYSTHFTLTLFDIDFFKQVNDDFGHPKGDYVLELVAELLKQNTRDVDFIFRMGGEEFAVISPHCKLDKAQALAEKYRKLIEQTDFGIGRQITFSAGISQSEDDCSSESIYKHSDLALYEAKAAGRNRVISFTKPSINTSQ